MKNNTIENPRFRQAGNVAWRRVQDEAVILDLESSVYYSLNEIAALIWELLEKGNTADQIVEHIIEEYAVEPGSAKKDVSEFLRHLDKEKLILPHP